MCSFSFTHSLSLSLSDLLFMRIDELVFQRTRVPQYNWIYLEKMTVGELIHCTHTTACPCRPSMTHDVLHMRVVATDVATRGGTVAKDWCHATTFEQESFSIFALRKHYLYLFSGSCLSTTSCMLFVIAFY